MRMVTRLLSILILLLSVACAAPRQLRQPRQTVKIALVAPFEGRLRQVGYDAFPALRLAIRQQVESGGIGDIYVIFIAYNDNGDPEMAARVAHNVALDPEVVAVIGHLTLTTTLAALNVYTQAGLPVLAPSLPADQLPQAPLLFRMGPTASSQKFTVTTQTCEWLVQPSSLAEYLKEAPSGASAPRQNAGADAPARAKLSNTESRFGACLFDAPPVAELPAAQQALAGFTDISLGAPPTPRSIVAYDAANVLLDAIRLDVQARSFPTRAGVAEALRRVQHDGLLGSISFDVHGAWAGAPLWHYPR